MTSRDQFEAWATEHLPTLYLTKTEQGTYESTATGSFFAVWSARDGEITQLKAVNFDYELHANAADEEIARLKGENEGLRKDAERWRFFSVLANDLQAFPHSWGQMTPEKMDFMCDQAMTDAAMSKGEQP